MADIAKDTAKAVGETIRNSAQVAASATKAVDTTVKTAETIVQLVSDAATTARKTTEVANAGQDAAIQAIKSSKEIIVSGTDLSTEAIRTLTNTINGLNTFTKAGLEAAAAGVSILSQFLSANKEALATVFAIPIQAVQTASTGINTLLAMILVDPVQGIKKRLDAWSKTRDLQRETAYKIKEMKVEETLTQAQNKHDIHMKYLDLERIEALKALADAIQKKQDELNVALAKQAATLPDSEDKTTIQESVDKVHQQLGGGEGEPEVLAAIAELVQNNPGQVADAIETREDLNANLQDVQIVGQADSSAPPLAQTIGGKRTRRNRKRRTNQKKRTVARRKGSRFRRILV
jgi:hypothetical protein